MTLEELQQLKIKILSEKNLNKILDYFPKMNVYDCLVENSKDRLDSFALNYLGRKYTYKELIEKIDTTAKAYAEMGVKAGDYVAMSMVPTPEAIISFFALIKLGAVVHMINAAEKPEKIAKHLLETKSKMYITLDILYDNKLQQAMDMAGIDKVVALSLSDSLPNVLNGDKIKFTLIELLKKFGNAVNGDNRCIRWDKFYNYGKYSYKKVDSIYIPNAPNAIAYTSGSTGESKGVVSTNEAMNAMAIQMGMTDPNFVPGDAIFNTLPLWIFYSLVNNIYVPLILGVEVDLDPLFNPKNIDKRIKQYQFNHWNTIPAYASVLPKIKGVIRQDTSCMKSITTGGDYHSERDQEAEQEVIPTANVGQGYGANEFLGSFSYTYDKNSTRSSVGKPLVGNRYKIVDMDDNVTQLGVNQVGEIYLFGPTMMKEYLNNPEATRESLIQDENGVTWYKTGDLGHYNENGELFIDGRIRRIEMVRDEQGRPTKLFPDKIKKIILQHDLVEKCEVITVPDEKYIKRPVAYIVLRNNIPMTPRIEQEIKQLCAKELESYTRPSEFIYIDDIPLKPSLKPDLDELARRYNQQAYRI